MEGKKEVQKRPIVSLRRKPKSVKNICQVGPSKYRLPIMQREQGHYICTSVSSECVEQGQGNKWMEIEVDTETHVYI